MTTRIWNPSQSRIDNANLTRFCRFVENRTRLVFKEWQDLYRWSVADKTGFWGLLAEFCEIVWHAPPHTVYIPSPNMRCAKWFVGGELNFAENLLKFYLKNPDKLCFVGIVEGQTTQKISGHELLQTVFSLIQILKKHGVQKGDVVAGIVSNTPEALMAMLAVTALGGVWTSVSPDFGASGILDRLSQVNPNFLFASLGYCYNGKEHDCRPVLEKCIGSLSSLKAVVQIPFEKHQGWCFENYECYPKYSSYNNPKLHSIPDLEFVPCDFSDPLYIMFSSGTTGAPKCMVHSVGGTLLQHQKELMLHVDLKPLDKLLFYTTCGWMMWNWMATALSLGVELVLYDGSPAHPCPEQLLKTANELDVQFLGLSPKYLSNVMKSECQLPSAFPKLRSILATGSPLLVDHYEWIYSNIKDDLQIASISGGTDIISCFMLGNPWLPVYPGEIQSPGLGMEIAAYNEDGRSVVGHTGELVCKSPFVSMPTHFLHDPDGEKYQSAYFRDYGDHEVWQHGDFVEITPRGGVIIYGRSDATLNPGGVRIGTAEIYRHLESLPEILDSLAIGWQKNEDVEIVLFVKLNMSLDESFIRKIKSTLRQNLTARHVPKFVFQVSDLPYTRNGKKVEIAANQAWHGREIKNASSIVNITCLAEIHELGDRIRKI